MLATHESFVSAEAAYRRERVAAEVAAVRRGPRRHRPTASRAVVRRFGTRPVPTG
jgi:hypothetical protein